MAIEKVVNLKVVTDSKQAASDVDKLTSSISQAKNESEKLGGTLSGSKESEFINNLGDGIGKLNPAFGSAVKGANGLILKMWEMVANPVGAILAGIVVTAKFLYEAFQSSVAGGKELKTIFAAISAVGDQVKDAIFGLGRALINTATAAAKFLTLDFVGAAEDMKKANSEASESFEQLGNAVDGTTFKIIKQLEAQQQANDKARKNQAVVQSETNKLLVQSREILTDETASIKEKKKALEEVTKAEMASSKEKVRIAAEDLRIAKTRASAIGGEAEKKMKQELRDMTIALNEAETENAMTGIKLNKQRKMLAREELSDAKEASDKLKALVDAKKEREKQASDKQKENEKLRLEQQKASFEAEKSAVEFRLNNEKLSLDEKRRLVSEDNKLSKEDRKNFLLDLQKQEIQLEENHNKAIADLNKRYDDEKSARLADTATKKEELDYEKKVLEIENLANTELEKQTLIEKLDAEHKIRLGVARKADNDAQKKSDKDLADAKKALLIQQLDETAKTLNGVADLFGKQTAAGKTAAVASATIETFLSAQRAYSATVGIPIVGPVIAPINAGLAIASGFKNIKSILGVKVPGGGGSMPSGGGQAPTPPQFNIVGQSGTNQLAQTIAGKQNQPIEAFVVSSAVTTSQALDRNRVKTATFGN